MKRLILCFFLAAAPLTFAQEKETTGHEEPATDKWIWWKWANFLMLAGALGYLIGKNAGPYFSGQTEEIQRGITEAGKLKAEAEAKVAAIEKRLAGLEAEIAKLRAQAQEEIVAEATRLKDATQHQLERMEHQTQLEVELMTKAAKHELKTFSADLALGLAEQRIKTMLDPAAKSGLVDAFIHDLHNGSEHSTVAGGGKQ